MVQETSLALQEWWWPGKSKTKDSKLMFQTIVVDLASSNCRAVYELGISLLFITAMTSTKASLAVELCLTLPTYCRTF